MTKLKNIIHNRIKMYFSLIGHKNVYMCMKKNLSIDWRPI